MVTNIKDSMQSWELKPDGTWKRVAQGKKPISAHRLSVDQPLAVGPWFGVARTGDAGSAGPPAP